MPQPRTASRTQLFIVSAVLVAFAVSWPALFWRGGSLELETISFITNYSADRPLLEKIFDPWINDFGNYQARELSYFADYVDAAVYRWLVSAFHRPVFVPLSALVSSALLVGVFLSGVRRSTRHVDAVTAGMLLTCLLTSFQFVFTMGMFYRSSKPILAVALLALLFRVVSMHPGATGRPATVRDGLSTFGLALLCGLVDRQGFYYVIVVSLLLAGRYVRTREGASLVTGTCSAFIVLVLYNLVLAPTLIHALNGYWPDFSMQKIALGRGSLVAHPRTVLNAFQLLAENTGLLLGGLRYVGFLIVPAFLVIGGLAFRDPAAHLRRYFVIGFGFQLLMFALMIQKLPQFYDWIDHRYWYYPLPFLVTVIFAGVVALDRLIPRIPVQLRWAIPATLLVIAAGNLLTADRYRTLVLGGPWFGEIYTQSERLKTSFQNGSPDPALDKDYRAFYDFTASLMDRRP